MFAGHRNHGNGDTMVLVCLVISEDNVINSHVILWIGVTQVK